MMDFLRRTAASLLRACDATYDWVEASALNLRTFLQASAMDLRTFLIEAIRLSAEIFGVYHLWPHIKDFCTHLWAWQVPGLLEIATMLLVVTLLWAHLHGLRKHLGNVLAYAPVRRLMILAMAGLGIAAFAGAVWLSVFLAEGSILFAVSFMIIWIGFLVVAALLAFCVGFVGKHAM